MLNKLEILHSHTLIGQWHYPRCLSSASKASYDAWCHAAVYKCRGGTCNINSWRMWVLCVHDASDSPTACLTWTWISGSDLHYRMHWKFCSRWVLRISRVSLHSGTSNIHRQMVEVRSYVFTDILRCQLFKILQKKKNPRKNVIVYGIQVGQCNCWQLKHSIWTLLLQYKPSRRAAHFLAYRVPM